MLNPDQFPPEFGTSAIPEGTLRFNHYTSPEAVPGILREGLLRSKGEESFARNGTEYPAVFATAGTPPRDLLYGRPVVEGWAHLDQLDIGRPWQGNDPVEHARGLEERRSVITFRGDVPQEQIVAVHQPWHNHARYILEDPDVLKETLDGGNDDLLDDDEYGPAIRYVKALHGSA